jgi:hypothetical protein
MITALASGAFLGLSCGLAPGPLLALVLAQTLRHGRGSLRQFWRGGAPGGRLTPGNGDGDYLRPGGGRFPSGVPHPNSGCHWAFVQDE